MTDASRTEADGAAAVPSALACAAIAAVAYFLAARLGLELIAQPENLAVIWPAGGIAAGLLVRWWSRRHAVLAGVVAATVLANVLAGKSAAEVLAFAVCNAVSPWLYAVVLRAVVGDRLFASSRAVPGVLAAALAAGTAGGALAAALVGAASPAEGSAGLVFLRWLGADVVAMLSIAPFLAALGRDALVPRSLGELALGVGGLVAIALLTAAIAGAGAPAPWLGVAAVAAVFSGGLLIAVRAPLGFALASPVVVMLVASATLARLGGAHDVGELIEYRVPALQVAVVLLALCVLAAAMTVRRIRRIGAERAEAAAALAAANRTLAARAAALAESERRFRQMADDAPVMVWVTDADGRCTFLSRRWLEYTGQAVEQGLGYGWLEAVHPDDRPATDAAFRDATARGAPIRLEYRLKRADGACEWMLDAAAPRFGADGAFLGFIGSVIDIGERKQAEEQARRNRETFQRLVQSSPFGICVIDADFRLAYVSRGAEPTFAPGAPPIGRDFGRVLTDLWAEPFAAESTAIVRRVLATGEPHAASDLVAPRPDGGTRSYDWRVEPAMLPDGRRGAVSYFYDLSERRELERAVATSEERLRIALEATHAGVFDWDLRDGSVTWTEGHYRVLGLAPFVEPPSYGLWRAHVHPEDLERVETELRGAVERRAPYLAQYRSTGGDGAERWIEAQGHVVTDRAGDPVRMVGTVVDVTARKRDEVALAQADRRKDEFLATLAHELRNPLAPLRTALQVLEKSRDAHVLEQMRGIMTRQLAHMVRLVDDLLEVSRITTGKLRLARERLDLQAAIEQAVETTRAKYEARRHRLVLRPAPQAVRMLGDPVRLAQVFTNLLNNAAKYSDDGATVTVAVDLPRPDRVRVRVTDTGIGLSAEALPRVFELFAQVDPVGERAQGGLGIGLSLSRRLVEMHGGTLTAESAGPGLGSTFVVELPVTMALVAGHDAPPPVPGPADGRCRLVVADDNEDAARSLATMLELGGHEVAVALDGEAALRAVREHDPHVAILDIGMPRRDGYEVARELRRRPETRHVVLIALTGWGQDVDKRRTAEAGFDHHYTKPVDPDAIEALLAALPHCRRPAEGALGG